jgi:hypothetical protein
VLASTVLAAGEARGLPVEAMSLRQAKRCLQLSGSAAVAVVAAAAARQTM